MKARAALPFVLVLLAPIIVVGCRKTPGLDPEKAVIEKAASQRADAGTTTLTSATRTLGSCGTLADVESPEILRVMPANGGGNGLVLYANPQVGLAMVDVTAPDVPKIVGLSEVKGTPLGVFGLRGAAVLVYQPWDRPDETAVRAVEIAPQGTGRTIGEVVLPGAPRDARRLGDMIVVTREVASDAKTPTTVVNTFTLDKRGLSLRDEHRLAGRGAVAGGSPYGIAVAREAEPELGEDRTAVTWLSVVDDTPGSMRVHGTATVSGVVPRWRRATDHTIDVAEDARVRLVACATSACAPGDAAAYAAIDFAQPDQPRVTSWSLLARAGDGIVNFDGLRLIVARPAADRSDTTELAFFDTAKELSPVGTIRVRGAIGSVAVRDGGDVVALGWTGGASSGKRAIVHHIDARQTPKLIGAAAFGGDWTWSPAYDDDRAISFDPASTLAALPMTTTHGSDPARTAAQVLSIGRSGPRNVVEKEVAGADRLLFVEGRLLAFSADGVAVVHDSGRPSRQRRWDDIRTIR
jgi:hypothetical protein